METEHRYRALILDFGHPMNITTTGNVINSLRNILALGSTFRRNVTFGISILNSDFAIFQSEINLQNYNLITTKLEAQLKSMNTGSRITVREYKYLFSKSTEAVLCEFQKFNKYNSQCVIEIGVVTKKNATVLADILKDVTDKLREVTPNIQSVQKYTIVQILREDQEFGIPKGNSIECTSCVDNLHALNSFFKDWLLNTQQQLRILLSEDPDFGVECEIDDCVVNPVSIKLERKFDSFFCSGDLKDAPKPSYSLKVISRLPVGLNPTLVFGIPRHISASRSRGLSCTGSRNNSKIFKELCRELNQTEQGLLAKTVLPSHLTTFHFLSSDGDALLVTEVSPEELYLPKRDDPSQPADFCEDAASMVKACLKKIQYLHEYVPKNFSSGIYDHLRSYLAQTSKNLQFDPNIKTTRKIKAKDETRKALSDKKSNTDSGKTRKRQSSKMHENVHPALLTPNIIEKHRKVPSNAFNLPELDF